MRLREAVLEIAHELIRIIPEKNGCDAFPARGNQDGAQAGLTNCELDLLVDSTCAILGRSHAEYIARFLVKTPARIEACVVDRFSDAAAGGQCLPDLRCA